MLIEIFVTGHFLRHITRRDDALILAVACESPVIEFVRCRCGVGFLSLRGKETQLTLAHAVRRIACQHIGLTAPYEYRSCRACGIDVHTITTRLGEQHRTAGRADLKTVTQVESA